MTVKEFKKRLETLPESFEILFEDDKGWTVPAEPCIVKDAEHGDYVGIREWIEE